VFYRKIINELKHSILKKIFIIVSLLVCSCDKNSEGLIQVTSETNNVNQSTIDSDGDGIPDDIDQENNTRLGAEVDENGVMKNPIYLDENEITIKAKDWAISGDIGMINETEYEVVSEEELRSKINDDKDITKVCTSKISSFSWLFLDKNEFNQDIGSWDTSNVTATNFMFYNAFSFNQNIGNWDTSKVTDMNFMFWEASLFNVDIRLWDTSNVTIMRSMFHKASSFNQDLGNWDVNNVTDCQFFSNKSTKWTSPKPSFNNCTP
tara:strand:- start:366 stop:1157 length:792 start_codon:yes stop_codon:yes gene_type:complete